jgi:CNT family concentrative nucleoside transporter
MEYVRGIFGIAVLVLIAYLFSESKRRVSWRIVGIGLGLQVAIALILLKIPVVSHAFLYLNRAVVALQDSTRAGTSFVFGYVGGGDAPFAVTNAGALSILAFQSLALILVIGGLSALLWHWRVLPMIVKGFSWALQRTLGIGGAVGVASAANIFVGMVESPLLVKPYIPRLTRSEMFIVMTVGLATIAGTMMVIYATIIGKLIPNAIAHLLIASMINVPAAIMVARIMVPEAKDAAGTEGEPQIHYAGSMDAITRGTGEGLGLYLNVIAMLIVLVALVALANAILSLFPAVGGEAITLQRILGLIMAPYVWLMGVPWHDAMTAGGLMGTKIILNEFIAYSNMANLAPGTLSHNTEIILTYAFCGFANFGSLGIMLGGLIAMAPERRSEIAGLGLRSIVSGTLATSFTGAIVGLMHI